MLLKELKEGFASTVARQEGKADHKAEGVVACSVPQLFNRRGQRVMWKLKTKDFK